MDTTQNFLPDTGRVQAAAGFGQGPNRGFQRGRFYETETANDAHLETHVSADTDLTVDVSLKALITMLGGQTTPVQGGIVSNEVPPLLLNPRAARAVAAYQARVQQARAMQIVPSDGAASYADTAMLIKQLQELAKNGATHLPLQRVAGQSLEEAVRTALSAA